MAPQCLRTMIGRLRREHRLPPRLVPDEERLGGVRELGEKGVDFVGLGPRLGGLLLGRRRDSRHVLPILRKGVLHLRLVHARPSVPHRKEHERLLVWKPRRDIDVQAHRALGGELECVIQEMLHNPSDLFGVPLEPRVHVGCFDLQPLGPIGGRLGAEGYEVSHAHTPLGAVFKALENIVDRVHEVEGTPLQHRDLAGIKESSVDGIVHKAVQPVDLLDDVFERRFLLVLRGHVLKVAEQVSQKVAGGPNLVKRLANKRALLLDKLPIPDCHLTQPCLADLACGVVSDEAPGVLE
mmetsp:Transcript_28050/g.68666  ORF Transcript_28050/g.68666 Transcript_28050/m.68666 type:complete len:295 (-) Transcript_28050:790-1674(-)